MGVCITCTCTSICIEKNVHQKHSECLNRPHMVGLATGSASHHVLDELHVLQTNNNNKIKY